MHVVVNFASHQGRHLAEYALKKYSERRNNKP